MSNYAHVVKKAGHLINDSYLEKLVKNHRHYYGVAIAKDESVMVVHQQTAPSLDILKEIQKEFKDSVAIFAFGDVAHILPEDMQPFSILKDDDGNHLCVVCLDGDFDRHKKSNESHIAEYLVAKGSLERKLKRFLEGSQDFSDVIKKLEDQDTKEDISNLWNTHGSITFLFADGQVCTITGGNEKKGEYSWGFSSNNYGYMEQVGGAPPKTEDKKEMTAFDKLKSLVTTKPDPAPQNGTAVSATMVTNGTATAVDEPLPEGTVLVKPDFSHPSLDTRKKQKSFYEDRLGYEPQQYKNAPPLLRIPSKDGQFTWRMADTKSLQLLKHTLVVFPGKEVTPLAQEQPPIEPKVESVQEPVKVEPAPVAAPAVAGNQPWLRKGKKTSEVKEIPPPQSKTAALALPAGGNDAAKKALPASVSSQRMPILSPDQKQKVQEIMKKTELVGLFSEGMKKIIDPKDIRKQIETELPDFAKVFALGDDMSVFDSWLYEQFYVMNKELYEKMGNNPEQLINTITKLMFDFRNHALKQKLANLTNPNHKSNGRIVA